MHKPWHTIILGAGAGGLMCAGSFGTRKLVLEHNDRPGAKLSVTGGGKCNFSHEALSAKDYVSTRPHFCQPALAAFTPQDFTQLLRAAPIPFTRLENGQLFARRAADITQWLFQRAQAAQTVFSFQTQVLQVRREKDLFCVHTSRGPYYAAHVVVACGGLSYPALGASALAWQLAGSLGLPAVPPRPALVGLRAPKPLRDTCAALAGRSLPVSIRVGKHREEGPLLFTHEGISGPAVLQSSLYWQEGQMLEINFLPGTEVLAFLRAHKQSPELFSRLLNEKLPAKISQALLGPLDQRAADASKEVLLAAAQCLNRWELHPAGTAGYTKAEVTAGGLDTASFYPGTLECKSIPGLFAVGEALDVTGRLGGYNLHWAWASAMAAARALAGRELVHK